MFAKQNTHLEAMVDKVKVLSWLWLKLHKRSFNYPHADMVD
jgi:hypothetical protein